VKIKTGMRKLLVATQNRHKLEEYRSLLAGLPFELLSLHDVGIDEDVEETGGTFEENARLKAERYRELSSLLTLADDSGIEIDALGGEPGVHSRRWAGDVDDAERNRLTLERLERVPDERRTARYRCVIAIAEPGRETRLVTGTSEGVIAHGPRGNQGFGYDPIFYVPELGQTMGEMAPEVKNGLSHRGRAAHAARELLATLSF